MDLVSFIPGVGPTASFTPGSTPPPPFNVAHTGLTDGTSPATASSNMAEIYNRLLLNVAATITAAGLTIDNNNWAQLPQAVSALVNQALTNFTGSITTPPQFDNDSSLSTSAFVQRALGNYRNVINVITAGTVKITAAEAGNVYCVSANNVVFSVNPSGLPAGAAFTIFTDATYKSTISTTTGSGTDAFKPAPPLVTQGGVLLPRNKYTFVWDGTNFRCEGGIFTQSFLPFSGTSGTVTLQSGVTMMWGIDSVSIGETTRTVLLPWSFNNACSSVMITGRSDGTTITNNNIPQLVGTTPTSFTYFSQGIAETTTPLSPNQGVTWLAVGY